MIKKLSLTVALLTASTGSALAHTVPAEHAHAGPLVLEALPLPLLGFAALGAVACGAAFVIGRKRAIAKRGDER